LKDEQRGPPSRLLGVLGFDERYLARCSMRVYSEAGLDEIVLLAPQPIDEYSAKRQEEARSYLEKLAREYLGATLKTITVPHGSFSKAYLEARRLLTDWAREGSKITVCLSGGMRYAVAALLAAAATLPPGLAREVDAAIQADLESGQNYVRIPLRPLRELARLPDQDHAVLEYLWRAGEPQRLTDIAEGVGLAKSTTWKILRRLVKAGLVEARGRRYRALFPP